MTKSTTENNENVIFIINDMPPKIAYNFFLTLNPFHNEINTYIAESHMCVEISYFE